MSLARRGAPADRPDRAVSPTVGAILMTALVVLTVSVAATALLPVLTEEADEGNVLVDCVVEQADGTVVLTHGGGTSADVADLSVTLRTRSGSRTVPLSVDGGDGDDRFEQGERARFDADEVSELLLYVDGQRVCGRVPVRAGAGPPGSG